MLLKPAPLIRFTLAHLEDRAASRPPGYRAAVLALAHRDGEHYTLTPEAVEKLRAQFNLPAPTTAPRLSRVRSLIATLAAWFRNGCPLSSARLLARRKAICATCQHWTASAPARCNLCGCATNLKLRLATARCPDSPPRW